ncbi:MAG: class I SAM-dependent methyltransferase [Methanomassiliicoccales archaeon]
MPRKLEEMTDEEFVEYCYQRLLGRPGDPNGRGHWLKMLRGQELSRLDLLEIFIESDEARNRWESPFLRFAPPGHFLSPLPAIEDVENYEQIVSAARSRPDIAGIDLRVMEQIALLKEFAAYYKEQPFTEQPSKTCRYYFANDSYIYQDGLVLYCFLRHYRPRRVIEIGAGFSSAVMLDTNELFFGGAIDLTFIEPYPQRLRSLLRKSDEVRIVEHKVQEIPISEFSRLEKNDILFVDSSHVVKLGSDVSYILFEVLPALKPGVLIHFHDIFWPFEYPREWYAEGRAWNEIHVLRAFLSYNISFEILCFNSYMAMFHRDLLSQLMPLALKGTGGSLWIRKITIPQKPPC